ncbi:hypothetical protein AXG93_557s1020 [Marchantia polymorpha subsp. ruderalis]|uniref:Uncharacterized protein n=1 Tax=Marchantia polymorpha subsp. ruderalis TaxID=1480154 RepID=A0A176VR89_MARPO|nr:hypothetical protein AXG93_557s1020 [Marchantia polymorpha subsp. ruderalis]
MKLSNHQGDVLGYLFARRLTPVGDPPSPRAAHAATAVGTMVVIQGGIGPAGLSTDDLHVLDLTQSRPRWHSFWNEKHTPIYALIYPTPKLQHP